MDYSQKMQVITSASQDDIDRLTSKQKIIVSMLRDGYNQNMIAQQLSCSRQNVSQTIDNVIKKIHGNNPGKREGRPTINYQDYAEYDLSVLTDLERLIMEEKISAPQKKNWEIAEMVGTTANVVNQYLCNAIQKLNGSYNGKERHRQYYIDNRDKIREQQKKYREEHKKEHREYNNRYYHERLEEMRAYNRRYYHERRKNPGE